MTVATILKTESNLGFRLDAPITAGATTANVRFYNLVTGEATEPSADNRTNLLVTVDKDNDDHEIMIFGTVAAAVSGVSAVSGIIRGIDFDGLSATAGTGTGHRGEAEGGCADPALLFNQIYRVFNGELGTGGTDFGIGDGTASDLSITFHNDHTTNPKIFIDDSASCLIRAHRGDDEGAAGNFSVGRPQLTTAERDAISGWINGDVIYNTTLGQTQFREGGTWVTNAAGGSVANAADGTAGKVDIASTTEIGAGTAVDAVSGAINVIPVSVIVKTSSGAGDENKIVALNSAGQIPIGFLSVTNTVPTGALVPFSGSSAPTGWLLCDGSSVSNDTYTTLLDFYNDDNFAWGVGTTANAFTADNTTDTFTDASHGLSDGEIVYVRNSGGGLPTGLTADTLYYIISATTDTFQLSLTSGGAAIDITTDGTGTQNWYNEFKVPDLQGNIPVGKDSGTFATLGDTGGAETHTLTVDEMPSHTHTFYGDAAGGTTGAATASRSGNQATTSSTGGGSAHNNLQPYIVTNYIVKT